jgi:transposase-like protein
MPQGKFIHPAVKDAAVALVNHGGYSIREAAQMTGMTKTTLHNTIRKRLQQEHDDALGQGTAHNEQRALDQVKDIRAQADAYLTNLLADENKS